MVHTPMSQEPWVERCKMSLEIQVWGLKGFFICLQGVELVLFSAGEGRLSLYTCSVENWGHLGCGPHASKDLVIMI